MERAKVTVLCRGCGGTFRCLEDSVAYRERLCNLCAEIRDAEPDGGW